MKLTDLFLLFGGLALFLYGMTMMSNGLEVAAGNRLKGILEKLTTNRFLGVLVGAGITAVIQSSSATTVMVVGFVNSGLMNLSQAVGVIMGANIGTTITGQLIALDIGAIAPLIAFAGVILAVFVKGKTSKYVGEIIAGLGILFLGMDLMGQSMEALRQSETFINMMTTFTNPFLGILAGALFTAVIQSSSASIGILQTLAASGLIGIHSAVYVLFGQNIGTCITAVIASVGAKRNAKRTTLIHLLFNVIGTVIFVAVCQLLPFTDWIAAWTPDNAPAQLANVHTIFNIVTTVLLFPFGNLLAALARKILPELPEKEGKATGHQLLFAKETNIGATAIAIDQLQQEESRMFTIAKENTRAAFEVLLGGDHKNLAQITEREETIDYLNTEITRYISKVSAAAMSDEASLKINAMFDISSNIERIGDHATNMAEYVQMFDDKGLALPKRAVEELRTMQGIVMEAMGQIHIDNDGDVYPMLQEVSRLEKETDDLNVQFRNNQIQGMKEQQYSAEVCVIYSEMLTDVERILDHTLNIAQALSGRVGVSGD